jgi:hypothetical protein
MTRVSVVLATGIVGVLAMTSSMEVHAATTAPRWSKPVVVSHTCRRGTATTLQAARNARGDALVAWIERYCGTLDDGRWRVVAVSRRAGHRFGRPRVLHSGGRPWSQQLDIALDARGGGTVAWTREPAYSTAAFRDTALLVATRRPGGRFGRPRLIDEHGGWSDLAANPRGETVLTWVRFIPPNSQQHGGRVVAAIRPPGRTSFGPAQTLSGPVGRAGVPAVAIAPDGAALASWGEDGGAAECCTGVEAAFRPPGGRFGPPTGISAVSRLAGQAVAIVNRSAGVVTWTTNPNALPPFNPFEPQQPGGVFASRWSGQAFSAPVTLLSAFDVFSGPDVLLGRDGKSTVEWYQGHRRATSDCGLPSRLAITSPTEPPEAAAMISPPNGIQAYFVSALDANNRPIRAWFQATSVDYEKYNNCWIRTSRVGAAINGGPTIHGPEVKGPSAVAFAAAPARTPMLVWSVRGRVVMSTLRGDR